MTHADGSGTPGARPPLAVTTQHADDGAWVCRVAGDLDLDSVGALAEALNGALRADPPPRLLAVDLAGVGFCDSTGLNVFLRARQEAELRGVPLHLVGLAPGVLHVLRITGADVLFTLHDRVDQALA